MYRRVLERLGKIAGQRLTTRRWIKSGGDSVVTYHNTYGLAGAEQIDAADRRYDQHMYPTAHTFLDFGVAYMLLTVCAILSDRPCHGEESFIHECNVNGASLSLSHRGSDGTMATIKTVRSRNAWPAGA